MRKLVVCNIMSLDGYYAGPDDNVMVLPFDHNFDAYNAERLRAADTLLTGRVSYEGFRSYWPTVVDDPDVSPAEREVSRLNNAIDKVVVSDTLRPDPTQPWHDNTRIVRRADAHTAIAELKRRPGKDILMFGSRTLWTDLLRHGLVDELHLTLGAGIVGGGTPLFDPAARPALRLVGVRTWDRADNIVVHYHVDGGPGR